MEERLLSLLFPMGWLGAGEGGGGAGNGYKRLMRKI